MNRRTPMLVALAVGLVALAPAGVSAQDDAEAAFFEMHSQPSGEPTESTAMVGDREVSTTRYENVAMDAGDARASGIATIENSTTGFQVADGAMSIGRVAQRIVNDDGAWAGTGSIALSIQPGGPPTQLAMFVRFVGEGAYDGLILEVHGEEPDEFLNQPLWGVIYPADAVPPTPDPIQAR